MNEFLNKTKIKWSVILLLLLAFPLIGVPWLMYEVWVLYTQQKLVAIFRIIENIDPPKVSFNDQEMGKKYSKEEIRRLKNVMIEQEDFWDENLSTEFCIAYRTRDILLCRDIVNNFVKSRVTAKEQSSGDLFLASLWQDYFKRSVTSELSLGAFWAIFINPSQEFIDGFSKFDNEWLPKVIESQFNHDEFDDEDILNKEMTDLFRMHRNKNYWENDDDWMWFFRQYVHFLLNSNIEPDAKLGMQCFLHTVIEMQKKMEESGWNVDYSLYDEPLRAWGGQTIMSKIRHWLRANKLARDLQNKGPLS